MKTTYTTTSLVTFKKFIANNIQALIVAFVFTLALFNCNQSFSQVLKAKPQLNMGVDAYVSGNGLGAFYCGYAGVSVGRHIFNVGPCMQSSSMLMRGGRVGYSYILTGYKDKSSLSGMLEDVDESIQLRFFTYGQYVDRLPMSHAAASRETKLNSNERDWNSLRFSTVEVGAGIGLNVRVSKRVYWRNTLAISGYYHVNCPANLNRDRSALMLTIGTGFNIPSM